jgi:hypothetical protein
MQGIVNLLARKAHCHEMIFGDFPDHILELLLRTATLRRFSVVALHSDTRGGSTSSCSRYAVPSFRSKKSEANLVIWMSI